MRGLGGDLLHATRGLARTPAATLAALATLAIGIGANTAVFSVVQGVLLRPLPFDAPAELVALSETHGSAERRPVAPANYLDWRARSETLASLSAVTVRAATLQEGPTPARVAVAVVSGNFFETLRVDAGLGRTFDPALRIDPSLHQVVLAHALWAERFGAAPEVIGATIRLDESVYDVIGVAPAALDYPHGVDLWVRAPQEAPGIPGFAGNITQERTAWYFDVIGRLADEVTIQTAQAELDAIAARLRLEHPVENEGAGVVLSPMHDEMVGSSRPLLFLLLGAVGLVLLASSANVAILTLLSAERRARDLAVRAALGASADQLVRLVLVEGLVLAAAGGTAGAAVGWLALPGVRALLPADLPRRNEIVLDGTVLAFTLLVSLLTCVVFAAAPALLARRADPSRNLVGRPGDAGGRTGSRTRRVMVATQVALGVVLATACGLIVRSLGEMAAVDPGFAPDGLATLRVSFPDGGVVPDDARRERWRVLRAAVQSTPGVRAAGVGISAPTEVGPRAGLRIVGAAPPAPDADMDVAWQPMSPGYLEALGVPLLAGRPLAESDRADGQHVAVVSQAFVRRFFPGGDGLGGRVTIGLDRGHGVEIEIVGIAADTRNRGPVQEPFPVMYRPLAQAGGFGGGTMLVAARGTESPASTLGAVAASIHRADPGAVVYGEAAGDDLGARFVGEHRLVLGLLSLFAALTLGLAAVGIYGVAAHQVTRQRRELGIRMAIGATRSRVWKSVVAGGLRLTSAGLVVGIVAAVFGARAMASLLFRVAPSDPLTLGAVVATLLLVATAALAIPAAQAVRVDPAAAMREE